MKIIKTFRLDSQVNNSFKLYQYVIIIKINVCKLLSYLKNNYIYVVEHGCIFKKTDTEKLIYFISICIRFSIYTSLVTA